MEHSQPLPEPPTPLAKATVVMAARLSNRCILRLRRDLYRGRFCFPLEFGWPAEKGVPGMERFSFMRIFSDELNAYSAGGYRTMFYIGFTVMRLPVSEDGTIELEGKELTNPNTDQFNRIVLARECIALLAEKYPCDFDDRYVSPLDYAEITPSLPTSSTTARNPKLFTRIVGHHKLNAWHDDNGDEQHLDNEDIYDTTEMWDV